MRSRENISTWSITSNNCNWSWWCQELQLLSKCINLQKLIHHQHGCILLRLKTTKTDDSVHCIGQHPKPNFSVEHSKGDTQTWANRESVWGLLVDRGLSLSCCRCFVKICIISISIITKGPADDFLLNA